MRYFVGNESVNLSGTSQDCSSKEKGELTARLNKRLSKIEAGTPVPIAKHALKDSGEH
jgi:hypothetical protein